MYRLGSFTLFVMYSKRLWCVILRNGGEIFWPGYLFVER